MDPFLPPPPSSLPSEEEFQKFFLYIGYDTISDRHQQQQQNPPQNPAEKPQHQQYRKFVQSNKDSPWAKDLLAAVASVNRSRNHYKTFIPMLVDRNMGALYRVCNDIVASNTPPHREVQYMERCYITGVWQDKNIDISKGGRGSGGGNLSNSNSNATSPMPSPCISPGIGGSLGGSSLGSPLVALSSPTIPIPPPLLTTSTTSTSIAQPATTTGGGGIYISPRFKHFAQMLWTIAKLDVVIKNYACDWFNGESLMSSSNRSRQCITTKFGQDSQEFCRKLHMIFTHAVLHVSKMGGENSKRGRYTVLSAIPDGGGGGGDGDVDMEDVPPPPLLSLSGSRLM